MYQAQVSGRGRRASGVSGNESPAALWGVPGVRGVAPLRDTFGGLRGVAPGRQLLGPAGRSHAVLLSTDESMPLDGTRACHHPPMAGEKYGNDNGLVTGDGAVVRCDNWKLLWHRRFITCSGVRGKRELSVGSRVLTVCM